jgi:hypothetical protein
VVSNATPAITGSKLQGGLLSSNVPLNRPSISRLISSMSRARPAVMHQPLLLQRLRARRHRCIASADLQTLCIGLYQAEQRRGSTAAVAE